MQVPSHDRAIAIFDAFLRHAREIAATPGMPAKKTGRLSSPPPPAHEERTEPSFAMNEPEATDSPTRISMVPAAMASAVESDSSVPPPAGRPSRPSIPVMPEPHPEVGDEEARARIAPFVSELTVLIKYGHAGQVSREIERWTRSNPDDLRGYFRLIEFECNRVDATSGLDRMFSLGTRALDRGQPNVAFSVFGYASRQAPDDPRLEQLRDRLDGRSE